MIRYGSEGRRWPHIDLGWIESPLGAWQSLLAVAVVVIVAVTLA